MRERLGNVATAVDAPHQPQALEPAECLDGLQPRRDVAVRLLRVRVRVGVRARVRVRVGVRVRVRVRARARVGVGARARARVRARVGGQWSGLEMVLLR